jgi:hypothetical protein
MTLTFPRTPMCLMVAVGAVLLSGCSSSQPARDLHYGTDAGLGYVPPDASGTVVADVAPGGGIASDASREGPVAYDSDTESLGDASAAADAWPKPVDGRFDGPPDRGVIGPLPCNPSCAGAACGSSDGCGGTCNIGCVCVPSCAGALCGSSDGCGGVCMVGCICFPICGPFDCGTFDGCGGICLFGCSCMPSCGADDCGTYDGCGGTCMSGCGCSPSCGPFDCGASDGCGGICNDGCY